MAMSGDSRDLVRLLLYVNEEPTKVFAADEVAKRDGSREEEMRDELAKALLVSDDQLVGEESAVSGAGKSVNSDDGI